MTERCETGKGFDIPYCWPSVLRGPEECRCEGTPIGDANLADDRWRRGVLIRYYRFRARAAARADDARRQRQLAALHLPTGSCPLSGEVGA